LSEPLNPGSVIIYTGNGKGKTTAAVGAAVRAAGHGLNVLIIHFMKGLDYTHGETQALACLPNVTIKSFGQKGWVKKNNIRPEFINQARRGMNLAEQAVGSGEYDLVVLDEINPAQNLGLVNLEDIEKTLGSRPEKVSVIMTGRNADERLFGMADIVTEMKNIKHPYKTKIPARKGLEY